MQSHVNSHSVIRINQENEIDKDIFKLSVPPPLDLEFPRHTFGNRDCDDNIHSPTGNDSDVLEGMGKTGLSREDDDVKTDDSEEMYVNVPNISRTPNGSIDV